MPATPIGAPELRMGLAAPDVEHAAAIAGVLSDRTRAAILRMLAEGPHCVCELAAATDERQNNVSMHLAKLRAAGLVRPLEREGDDSRRVYYERDEAVVASALAAIREVLE